MKGFAFGRRLAVMPNVAAAKGNLALYLEFANNAAQSQCFPHHTTCSTHHLST